MNPPPLPPPVPAAPVPPLISEARLKPTLSPEQTLRRLYLQMFLRGRSARGLNKSGAPQTVGRKLAVMLIFYFLFGIFVSFSAMQSVFALSLCMHGMTFIFLGMFVASSAGEVLFNQQEADILLHRPIQPRTLLWAKISVMVQVSLWLAGALNLTAFFLGTVVPDGGWLYPFAHALTTTLEALFCAGAVVLVYQLCLRWFGRERLDGLMTTVQVMMAITMVAAGQIVPRLRGRFDSLTSLSSDSWWVGLLPPAWFAGMDDALAGRHNPSSWLLAGLGVVATATVLWLAFGKLAHDYMAGLQTLGESGGARPARAGKQRWLGRLVAAPPLCWWLRDSVSRASFQLVLAYLTRDRDMKLRVYPGLAPVLVMPFVILMQNHGRHATPGMAGFGIAFTGAYLGLVPMLVLGMLQYSHHWQAADLFRVTPQTGPAALYHGARRAVLLLLALPLTILFAVAAWLMAGQDGWSLLLLVPGIMIMPLYALAPGIRGQMIPLSQPTESVKAAGRGLSMIGVMLISAVLAGLATFAWHQGWFAWFLAVEMVVAAIIYAVFYLIVKRSRWPSIE